MIYADTLGETVPDNMSMNNTQTFGEVWYQISFREAVQQDLLTDFKIVVYAIHQSTVPVSAQVKASIESPSGNRKLEIATDRLAALILLHKFVQERRLRRVITYHNTVAASRAFLTEFPTVLQWIHGQGEGYEVLRHDEQGDCVEMAGLRLEHVNGGQPLSARRAKIERLRSSIDSAIFVGNVGCLTEGVDVRILDLVALLDPRYSLEMLIQILGRVMRKSPGKEMVYVLVPVVVPDGTTDPEKFIGTTGFKALVDVVRAMRAHDEDLARSLDLQMLRLGQRGPRPGEVDNDPGRTVQCQPDGSLSMQVDTHDGNSSYSVNLSEHLEVQYVHCGSGTDEQFQLRAQPVDRSFIDAILPHLVRGVAESWWEQLGKVQAFTAQHGRLPRRADTETLAKWLLRQRATIRAETGEMPLERLCRLEELPDWDMFLHGTPPNKTKMRAAKIVQVDWM